MLFLTDVDHVSFEKVKGARQNNLQSATVSLQVVIGLYKRKETAALKSKPPFHKARENMSAVRRLFFFCRCPAEQIDCLSTDSIKGKCYTNIRGNSAFGIKQTELLHC